MSPDRTGACRSSAEAMFTVNSPEFNIGGPCDLLESMISSRMLEFQVVMDKSYGNSSSLPGPVALETEKQQQLVAVGDYECPPGMSVNCDRDCERQSPSKKVFDYTQVRGHGASGV